MTASIDIDDDLVAAIHWLAGDGLRLREIACVLGLGDGATGTVLRALQRPACRRRLLDVDAALPPRRAIEPCIEQRKVCDE